MSDDEVQKLEFSVSTFHTIQAVCEPSEITNKHLNELPVFVVIKQLCINDLQVLGAFKYE